MRPMRRAFAGWLLAPPAAWLAGCAPEHDWREIRAEASGFMVMLPAKPATMTRAINLDGLALEMTMHGAQAREVAYTVGTAVLPDASAATRERALAAMRTAMIRNIGGTERASRAVRVALVDAAGQGTDTVAGLEVEAVGRMRDRDATLIARFVGVGGRVWQAVVLGPAPDREQAALFLGSLKLVRRE
ncbi:MAG: hypothetical protein ACK50I_04410 [Burkholderiales bacterium]|nr:hypothetical protein [Burkholderiales bacterium]MCZ8097067.1 hypothetical protein [Burkholderiales bacterium]